jgi:hypothetical protein
MKKKLLMLCGLLLVGLVMGGIAAAMTVSPSTNLTASELGIDHSSPGISGNYVVWDSEYIDLVDSDSDIYLYNLADPVAGVIQVTDNGSSYDPNIDNGRIVYTYYDGEYYSVRMYTIDPQSDVEIIGGLDGWESFPDISGNNIVFRTWDNGQFCDVVRYINLADAVPSEVQISPDSLQCGKLAVSGNYAVFTAFDGSYDGIYLKNLTQMATEAVEITSNDGGEYKWPNIDGNTVVYEDNDNDIVYAYDINAMSTERISKAGESADEPDIQGNNIVYSTWADGVEPDEWVTFFNMVTGVYTPVSDPANYCCPDTPAVYGNNILYLDHWDQVDDDYYDSVYHVKLTPTFDTVPGLTGPINITEGQAITTNPFIIKVYPTGGTEIVRVEFYIDGILIGTVYAPNAEGIYECSWDTSLYHSVVKAVAYDVAGESITIERNTTVLLELPYTGR